MTALECLIGTDTMSKKDAVLLQRDILNESFVLPKLTFVGQLSKIEFQMYMRSLFY